MKRTLLVLSLFACAASHADVRLASPFADHMVLQREIRLPVWGTAKPGAEITVEFAGQRQSARAGDDGTWRVMLDPLTASAESRTLTASGDGSVSVSNVVVGDVWLASGQSNMDSPMSSGSAANALPEANDPLLRFFKVRKKVSPAPLAEAEGQWRASTPTDARDFSAVAYFFARELRRTQNVPVGVINSAWGGTPIKTWMTLDSIRREPAMTALVTEWNQALAKHEAVKNQPQLQEAYLADMKDWAANVEPAFRAARKAYDEEAAAAKAAGKPAPPRPAPTRPEPDVPDPMAMPSPSKRPSTPAISYNACIAPFATYGIKGVIWYQGEADASRGADYRKYFPRLIEGWRAAWRQGDFAFLFVQLPGHGRDTEPVATQGIPFLREAQDSALALPATAMAVTLDLGDAPDVHPDNKVHVGQRLALAARQVAYGEKLLGVSPRLLRHEVKGGAMHLQFSHAGTGLKIGQAPWVAKGATPAPTDRVRGLFIRGAAGSWVEADVRIEGDTVIASHASVPVPAAARYGWAATPVVNLYNSADLPVAPFRTDP
jgi:sialate O-acetylesterase